MPSGPSDRIAASTTSAIIVHATGHLAVRRVARKPIVAIGIGYAAQEVDTIPITPRDARLDLVLTERETIDVRSA